MSARQRMLARMQKRITESRRVAQRHGLEHSVIPTEQLNNVVEKLRRAAEGGDRGACRILLGAMGFNEERSYPCPYCGRRDAGCSDGICTVNGNFLAWRVWPGNDEYRGSPHGYDCPELHRQWCKDRGLKPQVW